MYEVIHVFPQIFDKFTFFSYLERKKSKLKFNLCSFPSTDNNVDPLVLPPSPNQCSPQSTTKFFANL